MGNNFNLNGDFACTQIEAYDFETDKPIKKYESISRAARALYIRNEEAIKRSAYSGKKGKGVADYKTGKLYYFKEVK